MKKIYNSPSSVCFEMEVEQLIASSVIGDSFETEMDDTETDAGEAMSNDQEYWETDF